MITRKIGMNRGNPRLWLEGKLLLDNGFTHGLRYTVTRHGNEFSLDCLTITLDTSGARKIAGTPQRPIIDINGAKVLQCLAHGDTVQIEPRIGHFELAKLN